MNIDHLRIFLTLSQTKSLNMASKKLFMSPPAVKYALDALETELHEKLFERTHAGLSLTAAGTTFTDYAQRILSLVDEGVSRLAHESESQDTVLDAPWTGHAAIHDNFLVRGIAAFRTLHPEITINVRKVDSLAGEHFDIISGYADLEQTHAVGHPTVQLPLFCILPYDHPLASRDSIELSDLEDIRLLAPTQELITNMDDQTQNFLAKKEHINYMLPTCQASEFSLWIAEGNKAVMVIGAWPRDLSYGIAIPIEGATFQSYIYTQENPTEPVKAYIDFMQQLAAEEEALQDKPKQTATE